MYIKKTVIPKNVIKDSEKQLREQESELQSDLVKVKKNTLEVDERG